MKARCHEKPCFRVSEGGGWDGRASGVPEPGGGWEG